MTRCTDMMPFSVQGLKCIGFFTQVSSLAASRNILVGSKYMLHFDKCSGGKTAAGCSYHLLVFALFFWILPINRWDIWLWFASLFFWFSFLQIIQMDGNFNSKKAIIRVDFNVPLDENFNVTDTTRIEAAKPTIIKILEDGGAVILMSHLGRPKGVEEKYSLKHILDKVSEIIGVNVKFASDCVGEIAENAAGNLKMGEVLLLENLRFYAEEEKGVLAFAQKRPCSPSLLVCWW